MGYLKASQIAGSVSRVPACTVADQSVGDQVAGWWENVTGFLSNPEVYDWLGENASDMTNLWNTISGQGYATPGQQQQMSMFWQQLLAGQFGQPPVEPPKTFMGQYGGWVIGGVALFFISMLFVVVMVVKK
jgi:hypothetical protein